jgi:molybdopterin biosynthesis enzyme
MVGTFENQRIARLTPLNDVMSRIDARATTIAVREIEIRAAAGRTLAADAIASVRPSAPLALRDGWAVRAEATADAGAYAPAPLASAVRVDVGEMLPPEADAVAPLDGVTVRGECVEALAAVVAGDGVLAAGADCSAEPLRRAGERLRRTDVAVLIAAGIGCVAVREPRVRIVRAGTAGEAIDAAMLLIAGAIESEGGIAIEETVPLETALLGEDADAVIAIGGTGMGRSDRSVTTLARIGQVECHGVGLLPGETAAFGWVGARPVLLLPGRLDAALASWLVLGRRLLARLCGRTDSEPAIAAQLGRKVASAVGLAEVVPMRRRADAVEPLANGYLPLSAIARAEGWVLIPPESEGFPAGATVALRPWP